MLSGIADDGVRWRRRQRRTENGQQQQVQTAGAHPAHVSAVEAQRAATSQVRGDCGTGQARAECKVQTKARGMSVLRRGARWLPRDADHAWPEAPPWRRAAQRRQCGCDPKRDRHSPSTRIPRSCDRVEVPPSSCPPEPNPANGAESAAHDLQAAEEADPRKGFAAGALGT